MRNILYLLLFSTQLFFAQSGFENGNALYAKGKYTEAVAAYESVLSQKQHSSELYFNLANAHYKLNAVAPAIYNYEKALVLNPENTAAANNLKFAQKRTIDEIKVVPKVGLAALLHNFTGKLHYDTWAWSAVGFSGLVFLVFLGYYFSRNTVVKRIFFGSIFVMIAGILICVTAANIEKNHFDNDKPAIVFAERIAVTSQPRNGDKPLLVLHEGAKVYVFETKSQWTKIELTDGTEGWIESSAIKEVKD